VDRVTTEGDLDKTAEAGMTPLMIASLYISDAPLAIKVAQFLLNHGASVSVKTEAGKQVLHCAAVGSSDLPGLCSLLVDHGATLEEKCGYGITPMHWSTYN